MWPACGGRELPTLSSKVRASRVRTSKNIAKAVSALSQNQRQMAYNLGLYNPLKIVTCCFQILLARCCHSVNQYCQARGHTTLGDATHQLATFLALMGLTFLGCLASKDQECPNEGSTGVLDCKSSSDIWHLHPLGQVIQDPDFSSIKWGNFYCPPPATHGILARTHRDPKCEAAWQLAKV